MIAAAVISFVVWLGVLVWCWYQFTKMARTPMPSDIYDLIEKQIAHLFYISTIVIIWATILIGMLSLEVVIQHLGGNT